MQGAFRFEVDEKLEAARTSGRTDAETLREFMRDYVDSVRDHAEYDGWFRSQVEAGWRAADAGQFVDNSEVEKVFAERRALAERRRLS